VEAAVLGALGLFMLLLPDTASALWPWPIPPLLAQLYSCFMIAFAVIAALVAYDNRPVTTRNFTITSLALMAGVLLVSLPYLARFTSGLALWIWFAGLAIGVVAFGAALVWCTIAQPLKASVPPTI
jgi:hypothetical protein